MISTEEIEKEGHTRQKSFLPFHVKEGRKVQRQSIAGGRRSIPVGESVVVHVCDLVVDEHGQTRVLLKQFLLDESAIFLRNVESRPANPCKLHHALETGQCRDESTRGHLVLVSAIGVLGDGDGQSV